MTEVANSNLSKGDCKGGDGFRSLAIIPPCAELLKPTTIIEANKVGVKYTNALEYLGTHFRLLQEDCISSIREGVLSLQANTPQHELMVYNGVRLVDVQCRNSGMVCIVSFAPRRELFSDESPKFLKFGALLCISKDGFKSFFWAVVNSSESRTLRQGIVQLKCVGDLDEKLEEGHVYSMAESTSAYFEAYAHVLKNLQRKEMEELPFAEHVLYLASVPSEPAYLIKRKSKDVYDLESVFPHSLHADNGGKSVNVLAAWPNMTSSLDSSQIDSMKHGLTKKLALIQGPPGTGKTYVGLMLTKVLLSNLFECPLGSGTNDGLSKNTTLPHRGHNVSGPVLILCFTNHALDQFLEGIYCFEKSLIRYGSRSQSTILQDCIMGNLKGELIRKKTCVLGEDEAWGSFLQTDAQMKSKLRKLRKRIGWCKSCVGLEIVTCKALKAVASADQIENLFLHGYGYSGNDLVSLWLEGLEPPVEEGDLDDKDGGFDVCSTVQSLDDINTHLESMVRQALQSLDINRDERLRPNTKTCEKNGMESLLVDGLQGLKLDDSNELPLQKIVREPYPWTLSKSSRVKLHDYWLMAIKDAAKAKLKDLIAQYNALCHGKNELDSKIQLSILHKARVVGMTTSAAARRWDLLMELKPEIVIVEEAAEVLEAHIVASLTPFTKHLILIGDHMQLRPSVANHRLAVEYKLNVSLFERLISGGVEHKTLSLQRRMRPCISKLVRSFYPKLEDHESVRLYENVRGVKRNVFFLDHKTEEDKVVGSSSKMNVDEAEMVAGLALYLIEQQGYDESEVTILTMYAGQKEVIKRFLGHRAGCDSVMAPDRCVRVSSVDDFQGEESDIVILSLVRSNRTTIGFVGNANRVCVALSRARKGLYIFGNSSFLSAKSSLWESILKDLTLDCAVGTQLPLCCPNHPLISDNAVGCVSDFRRLRSHGACKRRCPHLFSCGHRCPRPCHQIAAHQVDKHCSHPCSYIHSTCGHICTAQPCHAGSSCPPCSYPVPVFMPDCGHIVYTPCNKAAYTSQCKRTCDLVLPCGHRCVNRCSELCTTHCMETVPIQLPCKHEAKVPCHQSSSSTSVRCTEMVILKLPCGHVATSAPCDSEAAASYLCTEQINHRLPCGHTARIQCHQQASPPPCHQSCARKRPCGHVCTSICSDCTRVGGAEGHAPCKLPCTALLPCLHRCKSRCGEPCKPCNLGWCSQRCFHGRCHLGCGQLCRPCQRPCRWKCEHHACKLACNEPCTRPRCEEECARRLRCGHRCMGMCGEQCPNKCRECDPGAMEVFTRRAIGQMAATARFIQLTDCGHICEVTRLDHYMDHPSIKLKLKRCPQCRIPIQRTFRYGSIVKSLHSQKELAKKSLFVATQNSGFGKR